MGIEVRKFTICIVNDVDLKYSWIKICPQNYKELMEGITGI